MIFYFDEYGNLFSKNELTDKLYDFVINNKNEIEISEINILYNIINKKKEKLKLVNDPTSLKGRVMKRKKEEDEKERENNLSTVCKDFSSIHGDNGSIFDVSDLFFFQDLSKAKNKTEKLPICEMTSDNLNSTNLTNEINQNLCVRITKRAANFDEPTEMSLYRRKKSIPILKRLWGHRKLSNCHQCSNFNEHLKLCSISNLKQGIKRISEKIRLNLKCKQCSIFYAHLSSKMCPDCQLWIKTEKYDRHIDECKNSKIQKDFCFNCKRE